MGWGSPHRALQSAGGRGASPAFPAASGWATRFQLFEAYLGPSRSVPTTLVQSAKYRGLRNETARQIERDEDGVGPAWAVCAEPGRTPPRERPHLGAACRAVQPAQDGDLLARARRPLLERAGTLIKLSSASGSDRRQAGCPRSKDRLSRPEHQQTLRAGR